MMSSSYHNAVGFSHGPQVDLLVVAAGDQDAPGLVAQRQAVHAGAVGHELLWKEIEENCYYVSFLPNGRFRHITFYCGNMKKGAVIGFPQASL